MKLRWLFAAALVWMYAGAASAQQPNIIAGRSHFDRGVEYYRDGNVNAALIEFKRAYDVAPNYRVLYNLGQVSNALNDYVSAQRYFQRYLQDGGSEIKPERKTEVSALISKLGGRIASVTITCNEADAQVFVDDMVVGNTPLREPVRVSAGTRRISASVSGRPRSTRIVEAVGGEQLSVALEIVPVPVAEPAQPVQAPAAAESAPDPVLWLGIATGALAVSTGVVGILAASDGGNFHDALQRQTTASELDRLHDRAATKALLTDILLGATAISGAVTLFFVFTGDKTESRESSAARLRLGAGSLRLDGYF
jgi:hypothetical protein